MKRKVVKLTHAQCETLAEEARSHLAMAQKVLRKLGKNGIDVNLWYSFGVDNASKAGRIIVKLTKHEYL